ncbi:unnamed protein product [Moneuplotes crassus]|uniref:Ubiquitin-like domain-containing protein n=1 Tax=Euplotes crassus TaxID=5936 RepID=A0AAD1Y4J2_EUPCR|nr:unnamed protein product [Moneuplotes crassus]
MEEKDNEIQVFVESASGATYMIQAKLNETVADLKEKIERKSMARIEYQKLAYCGKRLSDEKVTLKDANFSELCTVHLLVVVTGGHP